jgi:hypothetical protein
MHPKRLSLQLFALKAFGAKSAMRVDHHVENCQSCQGEVEQYRLEFQTIRAALREKGTWTGPDASIWIVNRKGEAGYYVVGSDGWDTSGVTADREAAIRITLALYAKRRCETARAGTAKESLQITGSQGAALNRPKDSLSKAPSD